jgi:Peptidase family M23/N-acetylmuramoyl-L-alanine amidase
MTGWPVPKIIGISTQYGKRGKHWSCRKVAGLGIHTGVDFAAPEGTPVYATIAGEVRHRNYGSAFGKHQVAISPDPGEPFADGEVFYAHMRSRVADGTRVKPGDKIGEVGSEGNVTGPHLHYEFHPKHKNRWNCDVVADPSPTLNREVGASDAIPHGKVYLSKLKYGQMDSDSVKRLQMHLNDHSLKGGQTLPVSGNYLDETDEEVRLCQQQHGFGNDPAKASYVGRKQAEHLFTECACTLIDDVATPMPPAPALMAPGAKWDPIAKSGGGWFLGLRPFKGTAKKITLHTTETVAKPNWTQQQSGIPHFTFNTLTGDLWQHLPLDIAAYTLTGGAHSPNSDSGVNIQIEMVGFAGKTPDWSDAQYGRIRDLLTWISGAVGVPYEFPYAFGASGEAQVLDWSEWEPLDGIVGHEHAPYNVGKHWDPGDLDTSRLVDAPPEPPEPPGPDPVPPITVPIFPDGTIGVMLEADGQVVYTYWPVL